MGFTRSNYGHGILFAEAKARIDEILQLIIEHNAIAETIRELGYGEEYDPAAKYQVRDIEATVLVPHLELISTALGCATIQSSEILDQILVNGQRAVKPKSSKRYPVSGAKEKLGPASNRTCFYCSFPGDDKMGPDNRLWHVDHAYPLAHGGDNQMDNLVLSCATCNLEKKTKTAMAYFAAKLEAVAAK